MIPASFEYHAPDTLDDAVALLQRYPEEARLLAGGQSLIPMMKLRLASPGHLVDLGKVKGLAYVHEDGDALAIGPMTTYATLANSPVVRRAIPVLAEAAGLVADVQVRNRGTVGGSAAHADPAADMPAVLVAMEARFHTVGGNGARTISANEFFLDVFTTALAPAEVVKEISMPLPSPRTGGSYQKFANKASHFAVTGVAAFVTLDDDGRCKRVRIGVTGAGPKATRAEAAERYLEGKGPSAADLEAAAAMAGQRMEFLNDLHGSSEYREHLTHVLTLRALTEAVERAI